MRRLVTIGAFVVCVAVAACRQEPEPFDFALSGASSGSGFVTVDRLSPDRTKGIVVYVNLTPGRDRDIDGKYLVRLRDQGSLHLSLEVGSTDPAVSIKVYEFAQAVSETAWHHSSFAEKATRCWVAQSGRVTVDVRRALRGATIGIATVSLANVVFTAPGVPRKGLLRSLVIPDASIGGSRL